jgi:hypothetical protein
MSTLRSAHHLFGFALFELENVGAQAFKLAGRGHTQKMRDSHVLCRVLTPVALASSMKVSEQFEQEIATARRCLE